MARLEPIHPAALSLPPEAPLPMPVQNLASHAVPAKAAQRGNPGTPVRVLMIAATLILAGLFTHEMYAILAVAELTAVEAVMLGFFALNIAWISFSFVIASAGFLALLLRRSSRRDRLRGRPQHQTAILLPTYNEDPARVFGTAMATAEALADAGVADRFDLFVLSDTTDPDIWLAEEAAFLACRGAAGQRARIYYRRRHKNTERKAGNIAEWVRRFGAAYAHFIVFDADSLMSARTIIRMTLEMEAQPEIGLLQTVPQLIGGVSLFARLQQFAACTYGPVIATGLAVWSRHSGNYWGHNAILRTQAFAGSAGLPHLDGPPPFGGHIMSHDFVEAALMRRAGWRIVIEPLLGGSFEESPPSLIDLAERDRRWCQGNLQHARIISAKGLDWVSRVHMATGIMSYLAAPIWLAFLLAGVVLALQAKFVRPEYFSDEFSLFPTWPVIDHQRAIGLFVAAMAILIAPKIFGLVLTIAVREKRRAAGGALRAIGSTVFETGISALIAPVMMAIQSRAVAQIALGRDAGWKAQRRTDGSVPLAQIVARHREHVVQGLALGISTVVVSPALFFWMSPAIAGLVLAVFLSALTARPATMLRRHGLLQSPPEASPPPIEIRARAARERLAAELGGAADAFQRLLQQPALFEFHSACLPAPAPSKTEFDPHFILGMARIGAVGGLNAAAAQLSREEKLAVLGRRDGLEQLHGFLPKLATAA